MAACTQLIKLAILAWRGYSAFGGHWPFIRQRQLGLPNDADSITIPVSALCRVPPGLWSCFRRPSP